MKLIKIKRVSELTTLARSTIYDYMSAGKFPKQVVLGKNSVAWVEEEVIGWVKDMIDQREQCQCSSCLSDEI